MIESPTHVDATRFAMSHVSSNSEPENRLIQVLKLGSKRVRIKAKNLIQKGLKGPQIGPKKQCKAAHMGGPKLSQSWSQTWG